MSQPADNRSALQDYIMRAHWILMLAVGCLGALSRADDGKSVPSSPTTAKLDAAAFGRLPVWFNGRTTTLDAVARNTLHRVSERTAWQWDDGTELSPSEWLLQLAAGDDHWRKAAVLVVDHPAITELLQVPLPDGRQAPSCCTIEAAMARMQPIQAKLTELENKTGPHDDADRACLRLFRRLQDLGDLLTVLHVPDTTDPRVMLQEAEQAAQLHGQPVPLLLPPRKDDERWDTLQMGAIVLRAGPEAGIDPNPAADYWLKLLLAAEADDAVEFGAAVERYETYLKSADSAACPFAFKVPPGWTEAGAVQTREAAFYSDTLSFGANVTVLEQLGGAGVATMRVNYFPEATAAAERILDDWRVSEGVAPSAPQLGDTLDTHIGETAGWLVDLTSPFKLTGRDERLIGASCVANGHTWVVTLTGPAAVVDQLQPDFKPFLDSLRWGEPGEIEQWFRFDSHRHPGPEVQFTLLAAIVPVNEAVWVLQTPLVVDQQPNDREAELRAWLESLQPMPDGESTRSGQPQFTWSLPPRWQAIEPPSDDAIFETVLDSGPAWWSLRPLKVKREFDTVRLVNHWRAGTLLPPLSAEQADAAISAIETPVGRCWLVRYDIPQSLP
jgi:hypothetical protein